MTPEERIEEVNRAIQAWNRRDLAGFLEGWHPAAEWRPAFPKGTEGTGTVFRGQDAIVQAWRNVRAVWSEYELDVQEVKWAGGDLVVLGRIHVRGKTSGVEIDSDWSAIVRFEGNKVISAWDWLDHGAALEAAGLSE